MANQRPLLPAAVADGRLPLGELDGRLTRAYEARTPGELRSAARGLPELGLWEGQMVSRAATFRFALGPFGVFGGRGAPRAARPGAPRVVVKGVALFGAVVVKSPRQAR